MGVVYQATHLALERVVALKLIAPEFAADEEFRERFKRESRIAASINHPNVIPIHHAGEEDGHLFITMHYVEGTDLREMIAREGRLEGERAVWVLAQVASALDAAHRRGLVHRDVKPANILIEGEGGDDPHAYLTDFGLTKHAASESRVTRTGTFVGTLDYMAPEQLQGGPVDARADVYSLGAVLYQALTGEVPFPRDTEPAKMLAHMTDRPTSVLVRASDLPPQLDEVIGRAMAKEAGERYPSAGDLCRAASAAVEGRSTDQPERTVATGAAAPAEAAEELTAASATAPGVEPATKDEPPATRKLAPPTRAIDGKPPDGSGRPTPRGKLPLALAAGAAILVVAAAVAGAAALSGGDESPVGCTTAGEPGSSRTQPLTAYSSLPFHGEYAAQAKAVANGAKLALEQAGGRAGGCFVRHVSLDDSTAAAGGWDAGLTRGNALRAAQDPSAVAYIGEFNSPASAVSIPLLNRAGIAQISPSNTVVGLTRNEPGTRPGEPDRYYPTGRRTYARIAPNDAVQGAALATLMQDEGCTNAFLLHDRELYGSGLAATVERAGARLALKVLANQGIDVRAGSYRSLAETIKRQWAECVVFAGRARNNALRLFTDLGSVLPRARLFSGDGVARPAFARDVPEAVARRTLITGAGPDVPTPSIAYPAEGQEFFRQYEREFRDPNPDPYGIYGYEAMSLALDAIRRAGAKGNERGAVVDALFATEGRESALGRYSISDTGDTTLRDYGVFSIERGKLKFERVIRAR